MDKRQMKNYIVPSGNTADTSSAGKRTHLFKKEKIKNDLTCVSKSINLNTNEKIIRFRKSQTCEYCISSDKKILFQFSSSIRTDETVWSVGTSGVSLRKGCRAVPNDVTHTGRESCFYSQTPIEPCRANKRIFPFNERLHKRYRIPIYKNFSKTIRCDSEFCKCQKMVDILIGIDPGHQGSQGSDKFESSISTLAKSNFCIFCLRISQKQLTSDVNSSIIMSDERRFYFNPVFFDLYHAQFQRTEPFSMLSLQTPIPISITITGYIYFHSIFSIFIFKVFIQSIPNPSTNRKKMSQIKSQGNTRKLRIEYHYDRLLSKKIQQVYQTLVPLELLLWGGCCKLETEKEIETEQEQHPQSLKLRIKIGGDL
jgi:hypothetical protein